MSVGRIALPLGAALFCALAALVAVPRGFEAQSLLLAQDEPALLADHALDGTFDATLATREINAALAANDADLAQSFRDLARQRNLALDSTLVARVEAANSTTATAVRAAGNFGRGLLTGEPEDAVGLAGTALGDLFVFGDIRDAMREGSRLAVGEPADEAILALACVGIAVTAGTYATLGAGTSARVGLSLVKAARKTGRMTAGMGVWFGRSLREVVDWTALRRALVGASLTEPAVAIRAAREAVKLEKTQELGRMLGDVGHLQGKAGTRAALDGLKIAEGPRDVSRIARLAESKGTSTRAILRLFGRAAIWLSASAFNLFSWLLGAVLTLFGFCSTCKSAAERATERYLARRKRLRPVTSLRFAAIPVRA